MVETDEIEAVIGLGPNLFYNSPMEAMILIGNSNKPVEKKGKVLFVNGKDLVIENKGQAHLSEQHIKELHQAYIDYKDKPFFAKVATLEEILELGGNMNINFYVNKNNGNNNLDFVEAYKNWKNESEKLKNSMANLFEALK